MTGKSHFLAGVEILEHLLNHGQQRRHVVTHRVPQCRIINRIVAVAKAVAHSCDQFPLHCGVALTQVWRKTYLGFSAPSYKACLPLFGPSGCLMQGFAVREGERAAANNVRSLIFLCS